LAAEAQFPGQQGVVVATELLQRHLVTGMAPAEERHAGALLAWLDRRGRDPVEEAPRRALLPASSMLERALKANSPALS